MKKINFEKIEKFLEKEFKNKVDKLIIIDENNNYLVFGKYIIKKIAEVYEVSHKTTMTLKIFSQLKNAVSWCIFDSKNMINVARRLQVIDKEISSINTVIMLHQKLCKNTKNNESKLIYLAKLNEEKLKRNILLSELNQLLRQSDDIQKRNFV